MTGRIKSVKNSSDPIGNRNRGLLPCISAPQSTAHGLCTQLQIWRMGEILRLLQTKLNDTEPVHAVPMCLPNTCSLADAPFALAQKTTNEYFVQAAPSFRRSAAGLSTSNSYGFCREESGNGKDFSPSTSPLCTIPREPHILLRMYQ